MSEYANNKGMTRRGFMGCLAAGTGVMGMAATGITGSLSAEPAFGALNLESPRGTCPIPPVNVPEKWDERADVAIVGGGGSGLCAALRALEKGASVIVAEIMPYTGGASTHATGLVAFGSNAQKRMGIPFNEQEILCMAMQATNFSVNPWLLRTLYRKGAETLNWIEELGIELEVLSIWNVPNFHVPKGVMGRSWLTPQKEVTDLFYRRAKEKGAHFMLKTRAVALVREGNRIVGVKVKKEGETFFLKAEKGVILAGGGMSDNREMLKEYIPAAYRGCGSSYDFPTSNGYVIRMGMGAGADLAGNNSVSIFDGGLPYFEEGKGPFHRYLYSGDIQLARQPWLWVNKDCERFINEDPRALPLGFVTKGAAQMTQQGGRCYVIFDGNYEKDIWAMKGEYCERPLMPDLSGMSSWPERICARDWREDVKKAIDAGMIKVAPSIEGLAGKLGLDPGKLTERVISYNKLCEAGQDTELGKNPEFLKPVKKPPFYGIKVGSQLVETHCGLRVNPAFQVMDTDARVIPGLYAAFHTAGGAIGENALSSAILGDCNLAYTSGRAAGEVVALEKRI